MSEPVTLSPESVSAIASEVAELLAERPPASARLVDAHELADLLSVDRAWVYERADSLGAIRLGDGDRPRLRFDVERALTACQHRERRPEPEPEPSAPRRRSSTSRTARLLPIRGQEAA